MLLSPIAILATLVATTDVPPPTREPIACRLQLNAKWNGPGVTAVECNGVAGFFVESALYREMRQPETKVRLLEQELEAEQNVVKHLEVVVDLQDKRIKMLTDSEQKAFDRSIQTAAELKAASDSIAEASERGWYESPTLWLTVGFAIGVGVTITAVRVASL